MPLLRAITSSITAGVYMLSMTGGLAGSVLAQPTVVPDVVHVARAQKATVGLIAGGAGSTDARVAADMAQVLDDGDRLRVLPILGRDSMQNIADLIYLKGIDVAIVHTDVLTETMERSAVPREGSVQYIAKLFAEEIHVLARADISSLGGLAGKPVAVGTPGSESELTSSAVLNMCHVAPNITHDVQTVALSRLRHGEIAAMFVIGGKPVPLLKEIEPGTGLHFLPIPLNAQLLGTYVPTVLDRQHYPNLVPAGPPVDTVAVGSVLVTLSAPPDSSRAKRVNRFVDTLFERFGQFSQPWFHPKWQEVNLSAQIQGWTRYNEASNRLRMHGDSDPHSSFAAYLGQAVHTRHEP